MSSQFELPKEYEPYDELIVCSNTLINGLILFEVEGHVPLLVGKGEIPHIWLDALIKPTGREWISLIENNRIVVESRFRNDVLEISISREEGLLKIWVGKFPILLVKSDSPTKANIKQLDLRPIGLNIYGSEEGLQMGDDRLNKNSFENVRTMVKIGP